MSTTQTVPQVKDTAIAGDLYMSFELGDKQWKLSVGDGRNTVSRFTIAAGDQVAVTDRIVRAGKRFKTPACAHVHTCYEAGRDG
jgi:transposase